MTVATAVSRTVVSGNGSATSFAYTFPIESSSHLVVTKTDTDGVDTTLTLGSHYSVSGVGQSGGGSITYPLTGSALASGERLTMRRVVPLTQTTDLTNQGAFYAEVHEDEFDLLCMADQQLQEQINRSLRGPTTDTATLSELPNATDRAGGYLYFDASGQPTIVSASGSGSALLTVSAIGDGTETEYALPGTGSGGEGGVVVSVDGAVQSPTTYSISGSVLTFSQAPPLNSVIDLRVVGEVSGVVVNLLNALDDVVVPTPADGDLLTYNGTQWVAEAPAAIDLSSYATTSALTTGLATKANTSHTHAIADTTGLQAALDAKAASSHTHALDDLSDVTITAAATGHGLSFNGTAWVNGTQPYDLSVTLTGTLSNGEVVLRFVAPRAIAFAANFAGSYAKAATAATGSTTLDLAKNGSGIGTIVFSAAGTTGTFASSGGSAQSLAAGDVLTLTGPATADTTLANVGITLAGTRS